MSAIDYGQPIQLNYEDISALDFEDFKTETGLDLLQFARSMETGEITQDNFTQNLTPICALLWIFHRRANPGLTLREVKEQPLVKLFDGLEVSRQPVPAQPQRNANGEFDRAVRAEVARQMARNEG